MDKLKDPFLIFIRGIIIGMADIIPGVSGGTMALITGIYERTISAINSLNTLLVKEIFRGKFKQAFKNRKEIDSGLFIPLLLGIAVAILSLSHIMGLLLENFKGITNAFFFGMILASAIFVYTLARKNHSKHFVILGIGFVFALWFAGLGYGTETANHGFLVLFLSGAISICATILPGISGAFLLYLLNQYNYVLEAIKNFWVWDIIALLLGMLVGVLAFSKFLDFLLKKHKSETMFFLAGLMVGSLRRPYLEIVSSPDSLSLVFLAMIIGFAAVFLLEMKFKKKFS